MKQTILILTLSLSVLRSFAQQPTIEIHDEFEKYYAQFKVEGSFVLYNQNENKYIFYNMEQFKQPFSPASTFKICNSLIGLETGVITDEKFVIAWDSVTRKYPNWNRDNDLESAFKYSTVWYFQELTRRVGGTQMKYLLDTLNYGNADTTGGIDMFWLSGGLRISPEQQIDFLRRLHDNELPVSKRSMEIVKNIMITSDTLDFVVRSKTGWGEQNRHDIGWFVGYIETNGNVYYFANCIQSTSYVPKDFANARTEIVYLLLEDLHVTKK